jgi:very-short-patch-repair endonuclease
MPSPIEEALRAALLRPIPRYWIIDGTDHASAIPEKWGDFANVARWIEPIIWLDDDDDRHNTAIYIYRSVSVLSYRVDLMLEFGVRRLAIECDGHEFHDRTKQQAAYDRSRDRELLRIGIPTIRFTGSEIVHSPERCADEAYKCLLALPDTRRAHHDGWDDAIWLYESQPGIEEHW